MQGNTISKNRNHFDSIDHHKNSEPYENLILLRLLKVANLDVHNFFFEKPFKGKQLGAINGPYHLI